MLNKQRILFISPHTDDVELGAGGTLIRFLKENKEIYVVAFCGARESLRQHGHPENLLALEFQAAMKYIGLPQSNYFLLDFPLREFLGCRQLILDKLIELKKVINPDLVIIPSKNDNHQDHEVIHVESIRAFKDCSIWCYELPWNQMQFNSSCYVKLDKKIVDQKIEMLKKYESQRALSRAYFKDDFIRSLARVRGCQSFTEYAEAFEVIREYI